MAQVQYTGLVNSIKGKLGGSIFQGSGTNCQVKSRRGNGRVYTQSFQKQKNVIALAAMKWSQLTDAQRNAWSAMATNWPSVSVFGDGRILTGYNLFMKLNGRVAAHNGTMITDPSALVGTTSFAESVIVGFTGLGIIFTPTESTQANETLQVYASAPIRVGRSSPAGGFKLILQTSVTAGMTQFWKTAYDAIFGTGIAGMQFQIKLVTLNIVTGEQSQPIIFKSTFIP